MDFGILGLELSGKSTLFSLLVGHEAPAGAKREARIGVAQVPDPRLDHLTSMFRPRKHTPAAVRFVDVPGIVRGGASSLNVPELRTMDGLAVVLRAFASEAVPHPEGSVDPARDLDLIETELLLADLAVAENRIERLARDLAKRRTPALVLERDVLDRCRATLAEGTPLRELALSDDEERTIRGFTFLTRKPMLIVVNAGEDDVDDLDAAVHRHGLAAKGARPAMSLCVVSATLEEEISRLDAEDQAAFLADLGLPDRALDRLLRAAYGLLGSISFFTVGEDECRAWTASREIPAARAAGAIHSDIERGFIRAEVVPWAELLDAGSLAACRTRGTLRLEGKDYRVQDGDVINFRFAV